MPRGRRRRTRHAPAPNSSTRRKRATRRSRAGGNTGSSTTVRRTGIGSAIASGVRTVLGVLPGSAITTKLADVVFKMFGVATNVIISGNSVIADAAHFGCSTVFEIMPVNIAASSNLGAVCSVDVPFDTTGTQCRGWLPRYPFIRVSALTVRFVPTNPAKNSSGMVVMAWTPYTTDSAKNWYKSQLRIPTFRDVVSMPGAVQGKPGDAILLRCNLTGYCALPRMPNDAIGLIHLAHVDNSHTGGDMIKPDEFSGQFEISGRVESMSCYPHEMKMTEFISNEEKFADNIWDQLSKLKVRYEYNDNNKGYTIFLKDDTKFNCDYDPTLKLCKIRGSVYSGGHADLGETAPSQEHVGIGEEADFDMASQ